MEILLATLLGKHLECQQLGPGRELLMELKELQTKDLWISREDTTHGNPCWLLQRFGVRYILVIVIYLIRMHTIQELSRLDLVQHMCKSLFQSRREQQPQGHPVSH